MIIYIYSVNTVLTQDLRVNLSNVLIYDFKQHRRADYLLNPTFDSNALYNLNDSLPLKGFNFRRYVSHYDAKIISKGINYDITSLELGLKYNLEKDILIFYWDKQVDCHKYVLAINAAARKKVFTI